MTEKNPPHGEGRVASTPRRDDVAASEAWWETGIIAMKPGEIRYAGYAVEDLIGQVDFPGMVWLLLRGDLPSPGQARLLGIALMSAVDHGPQAPSIAIARMAMTCGVGINNAMASAINTLGDVHGGAGEQAVALYAAIAKRMERGMDRETAIVSELDQLETDGTRYVPGFGHRFHPVDPRCAPLLAAVEDAAARGVVSGRYANIARGVEDTLAARKGKRIPMNIDGATAVIYAELGFPPPVCRGLFVLSRSVGALAHAYEESQSGLRNKGPIPRDRIWSYTGPAPRSVPAVWSGDTEKE